MEVTTMEGAVFYERRGQIGYIILNRSHVLNAMNDEWIVALLKAAEAARADLAARVVVVRGAGRAFCAGADSTAPGAA
jgi:enoyl-CoA hydratase/carnithine racemase